MNTSANLRYTATDEWIRLDSDDIYTVGISDYAQHELGELVYVELPDVGRSLQAGQMFGVVESVKAVGELMLPVVGEIIETNGAVVEDPTIINNSPLEDGWLLKIRVAAGSNLDSLMDAEAYAAYRKAGK